MPDFLIYSLICGMTIALISGPLGSFVVWNRMAYFGDTLAHSALLGISLGVFLNLSPFWVVLVCCVGVALLMVSLESQKLLANDTILGILSHSSLALGLILAGLLSDRSIDLWAILFGDLLTVDRDDILSIALISTVVLIILWRFWQPLVLIALDENLAKAEGQPVFKLKLLLMSLVAVVVALAMKIVGVLLITSLLIIPAATSRRITSSPIQMAVVAAVIGALAVILGLTASFLLDTAAGPSIVLSASLLFATSYLSKQNDL